MSLQSPGQVTQPPQKEDTAETEPVTTPTQKPSAPTQAPSNPTQKPTEGTQKEDPEPLTYEEYLSLTPAQQQAYCESFSSMEAYMQWYNQAAEEYNKKNDSTQAENNAGQVTQPTEPEAEQPEKETEGTAAQPGTGEGLGGTASQGKVDF